MKKKLILGILVATLLLVSTVAFAASYVTETLRDRHGNTWVVTGTWGELDGMRVFYPEPPNGKVWVDTSRYIRVKEKHETTSNITVRDVIKAPTATLRQKAVGNHEIVMRINNPNYFDIKVHVELRSHSPDPEVRDLREQIKENVVLTPGNNELTFDSVKRHEGMTSYEIVIRVIENLHPKVHPDYKVVRKLGTYYPDVPLYIEFLKPIVTLNSNNASTEASFGTNWTVTNPNTIDFDYKFEIDDARGKRVIKTGRIKAGETISGFEPGIPTKDRTNTQTLIATLDPNHSIPKENTASFTFIIQPASISLHPSYYDVPMETQTRSFSTGCAYGPYSYSVTYQWNGAGYSVTSTVTNRSNIPIVVTATVDGRSGTYSLGPYGSTSGPSTSGTTHDPYTVQASTQWHIHSSSSSTTIPVRGWVEIARESYTCNPPPPEED